MLAHRTLLRTILGTGQQLIVISMVIGQVHQLLRLIILEIPQLLTGTVMAIP